MTSEYENTLNNIESTTVIDQVKTVQNMVNELETTIYNFKKELESVLLVDNQVYKKELFEKISSNCETVSNNYSSAIPIIQSDINSI